MPNHCANTLTIVGKPDLNVREALANYISASEDGIDRNLDCNKIVPMPEGIAKTGEMSTFSAISGSYAEGEEARAAYEKEMQTLKADNLARHGFEDWYAWRVHHWGTKWGCYDGEVTERFARFTTAWSPPIPAVQALARLTGLTLRLDYIEEGEDYVGTYTAHPDYEGLWNSEADECYSPVSGAPEEMKEYWGVVEQEEEEQEQEEEEVAR